MIAHYADFGPYYAAIYWRFLYEQCGGMQEGREDPAAGMAIIRRALTVLYSGEIVDVDSSTDTVGATPEILDRALAGSSCPFQTYQESLVTFARAVYGLRVDGGRCVEPGLPAGCGLYDPHHLYGGPPVETVTFDGAAREVQRDLLSPSSMDWIDILFAPAAEGKSLTLEFRAPPATGAEPNVQILHLADAYGSAGPQHHLVPPAATEACERRRQDGLLVCVIPEIHSAVYNRLGLIITNLDGQEAPDSMRQYTLALRPRAVP
jgi:hypothetical protein